MATIVFNTAVERISQEFYQRQIWAIFLHNIN